jgi:hypothetical protein
MNEEALSWHVAVEVAQQWIGHLVSPSWWHDASISRALARYLASMAAGQVCACLTFLLKHIV